MANSIHELQRGMLAQLAARLRARQGDPAAAGGGVVLGEDGEAVLVDDNCLVRDPISHEKYRFLSYQNPLTTI